MRKMVWLLVLTGCVRNQGTSLLLKDVVADVAPGCTLDAGAQIVETRGVRDVRIAPLTSYGYRMAPRITNQLQGVDQDPLRYNGRQNIRAEANNLTIRGFFVCYEAINERAPEPERVTDCEELGGASFLNYDGGISLVGGNALTQIDAFPPGVTENNQLFAGLEDVGSRKNVNVHLQAVAFTQDGRQVTSNEMIYPVELCNGCLFGGCPTGFHVLTTTACVVGQDAALGCEAD